MGRPKKRKAISKDYEDFGRKIKELREARNLNQQDLANELGIGKTTISEYEVGLTNVPLSKIKLFAEYFNVSIDYLIGFETNDNMNNSDATNINRNNRKWFDELKQHDFTDDEIQELTNYAQYILFKREKK